MAKRPFLLLYINDFLSAPSVLVMDNDQFSWYLRLLMHAWQNEPACCLPNKDYILMTWAGVRDNKKERMNWDAKKRLVLDNFTQDESGVWLRNARLDAEYTKMLQVAENKAEAGRRSAAARQQKSTDCQQEPTEREQKPTTQKSDVRSHTQKEPKANPAPLALPEWLPIPQWLGFLEMNRKLRKPMTEHRMLVILKKLGNLRERGHPPDKVLEQSIERSWQSVFELKDGNHGGISKQDERTQKSREAITRVLGPLAGRDRAVPQERDNGRADESVVGRPGRLLTRGDP